jgi:mono/diheme cytochrome c family protein
MRKVLLTVLVVLVLQAAALLMVMWSGGYNVSTRNHDNKVVNWFLDHGTTRSVQQHAKGIRPPPLTDPQLLQTGSHLYDEMCTTCHGAPGVTPGEMADGLWPEAPDLAKAVPDWTAAELFWITKYGIKFTAMPAWGPAHKDAKIWAIVAFLQKLPRLSPEDYQAMMSKAQGAEHPGGEAP